ncbi:MAG: hypothetical protein WEA09_07930 [Gemmatimonadota bacterium]
MPGILLTRSLRLAPVLLATMALVAATTLLGPTEAMGQRITSPYRFVDTRHEVSAFGGVLAADAGRFNLGPQPGTLLGVRYSFDATGPLSLESAVSVLDTDREVVDPRRVAGNRTIGETPMRLATVDGRLRLTFTGQRTWNWLSPHILAGGGVAWDMAGRGVLDEELLQDDRFNFGTSFVAVLGSGVRLVPTGEQVGLRADFLWNLWKVATPPGFRTYEEQDLAEAPDGEWLSAPGISVSLGIRFR